MSALGPFHSSAHRASQRTTTAAYSIAKHPRIYRTIYGTRSEALRYRDGGQSGRQSLTLPKPAGFEDEFIQGLVAAGQCQKHRIHRAARMSWSREHLTAATRSTSHHFPPTSRQFSAGKAFTQELAFATDPSPQEQNLFSKDELKSLVDVYSQSLNTESAHEQHVPTVYMKPPPPPVERKPGRHSTRFIRMTLKRQLQQPDITAEILFDTYLKLPEPRASHLSEAMSHHILHHFAHVPRSSEQTVLRYTTLFEDMKHANYTVTAKEWTTLIAITGRAYKIITAGDVENALHIWRDMESSTTATSANSSTNITFNVLYDIAIRSGRFVLADMIKAEMEKRNLPFNTFFRTKLIRSCGYRGDGDGVRREYRALIDSGCIVDTSVIGCVVSSLLRCRETAAAELTFERSKALHASKVGRTLPANDWEKRREIGLELDRLATLFSDDKEKLKEVQDKASLAPGARTYRALVEHHARVTGDIDRIAELVAEMRHYDVPLQGVIFMYLFKGFSQFGGELYSNWTRQRLENTWSALVAAINRENIDRPGWRQRPEFGSENEVYISPALAKVILKAFGKCCGKTRALEVWKEMTDRWRPEDNDVEEIEQLLESFNFEEWEFGAQDEDHVAPA